VVQLFNIEEVVGSLACEDGALYVGTTQGSLLHYVVTWSGSAEDVAASVQRKASVRLSSKYSVEQVRVLKGFVFALCTDGTLSVLPGDIAGAPTVLCRDVKKFCIHTGLDPRDGPQHPEVCVSLKKKLVLYSHNGRTFEQRQEFPTSEPACALTWHGTWICVGFRREYSLYSDRAGVPREICHLDGKFSPQIAVAPGNELLLLIQENIGLLYDLSTQQPSPKNTVTWPRRVGNIGSASNYVFGSSGAGQVDIFSVRDQKNCQTLTLQGSTIAVGSAPGGRALIASQGGAVACLDPVPFAKQVQMLLVQVRVNDALDLLNANFGPEDPRRAEQLGRFHVLAGWALLNDLQFQQAFLHFTYAPGFPLPQALAFWKALLPGGLDHPALGSNVKLLPDDGAPPPKDLEDFVREQLENRRPDEDSNKVSKLSVFVGLANSSMALFLLRHREALLAQERLVPAERGVGFAGDLEQLLRAVDTVLVKLLVDLGDAESRLQKLLDGGVRCTVADCEAFLKERKRFDVLAHLWKAQGLYELVLDQWSSMLRDEEKGAPPRAQIVAVMADALQSAACSPSGAELLRQYVPQLLEADPSAALQIFIGTGATAAAQPGSMSVDEVLGLLGGHQDLVLGYLENLVIERRSADPKHKSQLGLIYLAQAAEALGATKRDRVLKFLEESEGIDIPSLSLRAEELGLKEERVVLHCREQEHQRALHILVEKLNDLPRAEIYCRIVMARMAANVSAGAAARGCGPDVSIFCSPPPAWAAPEVFKFRRGGAAAGPGAEDGETETQPQPSEQPADGVATQEDASCSAALKRAALGLISSGVRPLFIFLRVLLDACEGAANDPQAYPKVVAEYREATLALLTGYAGHHDLPPHEVVGLLPADWKLESLAAYLTKCTHIGLHERRAGMLEENLSSMAYLKTFDALAQERMRKVTITGDRCCPVCNRRFVDKDSVGKAFVAYPNETCVHLQCKEDISVCPKTGQNFADNISVFCNALGTDPAE